MTDLVRQKILEVYDKADRAVTAAGPRCEASGKCCRFKEYGHTLFISHFEAEILLESAPAYTLPVSPDGCPFQVEGLCTARSSRPLGCRIYFCDPAYETRMAEITEESIAELKSIADRYETGWDYAPLHHFLNTAVRTSALPTDSMNQQGARIPLPIVRKD